MLAIRALSLLLPAMVLASCAGPSPQSASTAGTSVATAPSLVQPGEVDGLYQGTSTRFQADRRNCPHPGLVTLTVQNGQFEFHWNGVTYVDASIAPDGTVQGSGPDVTLAGHLDGSTLEGDVRNDACGLHFTTRRQT